jgi:hypothetical protein
MELIENLDTRLHKPPTELDHFVGGRRDQSFSNPTSHFQAYEQLGEKIKRDELKSNKRACKKLK